MGLSCYIPFYARRADAYDQLEQTIKSLKVLSGNLSLVRVLYCQPELEDRLAKLVKLDREIDSVIEPHLMPVQDPILLPTAAYRYIQADGDAEDPCFYIEADHILYTRPGFMDLIFQEIKTGSVVMPHRLGSRPIHKDRERLRWREYYVGNYTDPNISSYSNDFNAVTGYYNAYAGAFLAQRSIIRKHQLSFPWTTNILCRGLVEYIRRFSGRRLFRSQAPHGLLLEAPSLIFQANGQRVLKPRNIGDLYVIHLSQEGGV